MLYKYVLIYVIFTGTQIVKNTSDWVMDIEGGHMM